MTPTVTRYIVRRATIGGERQTAYVEKHDGGVYAATIRNDDGIDLWIGPNRKSWNNAYIDAADANQRRVENAELPEGETP